MADSAGDYKLYRYDPSLAAAIAATIVFALLSVAHIFQMIRLRLWFFVPFSIGCILEIIGYIGRAVNATQTPDWQTGAYIAQSLCLLLPPVFFAASIYMTLGRLISSVHGQSFAVIPPNWNTKAFVIGDVLSFLMQSSGGGLLAKGNMSLGKNIIVAGLVLQLLYFGLFVIFAGVFHYRFQRKATVWQHATAVPWKKSLGILYTASILIFVRSLFRTIEYAQGNDGYLITHEIFLYIFDAVLMAIVIAIYTALPPKECAASKQRHAESGYTLDGTSEDGPRKYRGWGQPKDEYATLNH